MGCSSSKAGSSRAPHWRDGHKEACALRMGVPPARPNAPGRLQYARGSEQAVADIEADPSKLEAARQKYEKDKWAGQGASGWQSRVS